MQMGLLVQHGAEIGRTVTSSKAVDNNNQKAGGSQISPRGRGAYNVASIIFGPEIVFLVDLPILT